MTSFNGLILQIPYSAPIKTREGGKAIEEAIAVMSQQRPIPPLSWSFELHLAADEHATDAGENGLIGHVGSNGQPMADRVRSKCAYSGYLSENIEIGSKTAEEIILSLLVDDGLPSRFHRHNILSDNLAWVGIGVNPHIQYEFITVITYAEKIQVPGAAPEEVPETCLCEVLCPIF